MQLEIFANEELIPSFRLLPGCSQNKTLQELLNNIKNRVQNNIS